jgi:rhodanese-related sulfurtransferase
MTDSMTNSNTSRRAAHSFMAEHPPAAPEDAVRYLTMKLAMETDSTDVRTDLERGTAPILIVDVRSKEAYEQAHVPGSISLPYRSINQTTTASIPTDTILVTYCWGPHCNAATKGALSFAALGYRVKEMIGGLEYWRHENLPLEGTLGYDAPVFG